MVHMVHGAAALALVGALAAAPPAALAPQPGRLGGNAPSAQRSAAVTDAGVSLRFEPPVLLGGTPWQSPGEQLSSHCVSISVSLSVSF